MRITQQPLDGNISLQQDCEGNHERCRRLFILVMHRCSIWRSSPEPGAWFQLPLTLQRPSDSSALYIRPLSLLQFCKTGDLVDPLNDLCSAGTFKDCFSFSALIGMLMKRSCQANQASFGQEFKKKIFQVGQINSTRLENGF